MSKKVIKKGKEVTDEGEHEGNAESPEKLSITEEMLSDLPDLPDEQPVVNGANLEGILKAINKKYGDSTVIPLGMKPEFVRIPTGVYSVDHVCGGGIPVQHSSCFFGGFSGGKTSLALGTAAVAQNLCFRCFF